MSTKISWCSETYNPIVGCTKISEGCLNCYAETMACRQAFMGNKHYQKVVGYINDCTHWLGKTVFVESTLTKPLHWRNPRRIFVNSMGDTFHESVPFEWVDRIMDVIVKCPQHEFLFLTKRAGRMREYACEIISGERVDHKFFRDRIMIPDAILNHPSGFPPYKMPDNLHHGATVENQKNVGRIADVIKTPGAKRFLSLEPLLESLWLTPAMLSGINYVFIGCESGPKARLCSLDDIRDVMHQCREAGVKVHIKQIPLKGKCNKHIEQWPEEFQVREV